MATQTKTGKQESIHSEHKATKNQVNWAIIGAVTVALASLFGVFIVGSIDTATQAQSLIEAMSPTLQMLAFATITATGTIVVLTMTMLTVMKEMERSFSRKFYNLIERIAFLATVGLMLGVALLTILSIPFSEAHTDLAEQLSIPVYYLLVFISAVTSGVLVAMILMLFDGVRAIIHTFKVEDAED